MPLREAGGSLRLGVKLTPKAARTAIQGIEADADGRKRLKVSVTAVPEGGKANAALIKFLAKTWGVPKTSLTITTGETSRLKELDVGGEAQTVIDWLERFTRNE